VLSNNNLPFSDDISVEFMCHACQQTKYHELPYPTYTSTSKDPLQLIFLMYGDLCVILLVVLSIMLASLMTIVNLHGSTCSSTNLSFSKSSKTSKILSKGFLIEKSLRFSPIGEGNTRRLILSFNILPSHITFPALMHINKMGQQKENIATS
jgi:hypothetical protein